MAVNDCTLEGGIIFCHYVGFLQVKEALLQKCRGLEQTAKEQATDNAILDQLRKVVHSFLYYTVMLDEKKCRLYASWTWLTGKNMLPNRCSSFHFGTSASNLGILCYLQMVQVDIPQSLLEEEGRQMYGTKLLEIQVSPNCGL